jgi:excisionase family DNA binding protein
VPATPEQTIAPRGFRIADAAVYLGVGPYTVESLIRSGQLKAVKFSRHYVIRREDCDTFLDQQAAVR